jgi:hypothetical protein
VHDVGEGKRKIQQGKREKTRPSSRYVAFYVFTAMAMKNCVFWDVAPCCFCKNRRFVGIERFNHEGDNVLRLLATAAFLIHRFLSH